MKYIVSTEHRFVYFVVPKVACSSIKEALLPIFPIDMEAYSIVDADGGVRVQSHKAFDESEFQLDKRQYLAQEKEFSDYLRFGFVRNPWGRLVSCYRQKLQYRKIADRNDSRPLKGSCDNPDAFYLGMPFEEFIEQVHAIPDSDSDVHFRSQTSTIFTQKPEERCLVSYVGRFETLADDFATVMECLGLDHLVMLGHRLRITRPGGGGRYKDHYDKRLCRLVAERFADDIRLFGYDY